MQILYTVIWDDLYIIFVCVHFKVEGVDVIATNLDFSNLNWRGYFLLHQLQTPLIRSYIILLFAIAIFFSRRIPISRSSCLSILSCFFQPFDSLWPLSDLKLLPLKWMILGMLLRLVYHRCQCQWLQEHLLLKFGRRECGRYLIVQLSTWPFVERPCGLIQVLLVACLARKAANLRFQLILIALRSYVIGVGILNILNLPLLPILEIHVQILVLPLMLALLRLLIFAKEAHVLRAVENSGRILLHASISMTDTLFISILKLAITKEVFIQRTAIVILSIFVKCAAVAFVIVDYLLFL